MGKIYETTTQRKRRIAKRRIKDLARKLARQAETPEEREARLRRDREYHARSRARESQEKRSARLAKHREAQARRRRQQLQEKRDAELAYQKQLQEQAQKARKTQLTDVERRVRTARVLERDARLMEKFFTGLSHQKSVTEATYQKSQEATFQESQKKATHQETRTEEDRLPAKPSCDQKNSSHELVFGNVSSADTFDKVTINKGIKRTKIGTENAPPDDGVKGVMISERDYFVTQPTLPDESDPLELGTELGNNCDPHVGSPIGNSCNAVIHNNDLKNQLSNSTSVDNLKKGGINQEKMEIRNGSKKVVVLNNDFVTKSRLRNKTGLTNPSSDPIGTVHKTVANQEPMSNFSSMDNVDKIPINQKIIEVDIASGNGNGGMRSGKKQADLLQVWILCTPTEKYIIPEPLLGENVGPARESDIIRILKIKRELKSKMTEILKK